LYTDWLYLWWIAYTNNMHGFIYIILKESLKNVPIIGWGCQFYNFIFLSRKWEQDQSTFKSHLSKLNNPANPMWLIIFPEGTNLSASTREKSAAWAKKNGLKDMKHQLLPRSTGLRFCLQELRETTDWLYDCTIAYEGVPEGQFGQDIFTLRSSFFEGRPPKSVNMHWRRFRIDDVPLASPKAFEVWLRNRWREKDYMLEYFSRHNRFPADDFWKEHLGADVGDAKSEASSRGKSLRSVPRPAITIETEVKSGNWNEFVKIFAPITSVMMALMVAYGASPNDLPFPGGKEFMEQHMKALLSGGEMKGLPSPDELEKMIMAAAKMGKGKKEDGKGRDGKDGKVQDLTQENLARLVKETAIQQGMVLPGGMRKVNTALPGAIGPSRRKAASLAGKPGVGKTKNAGSVPPTNAALKLKTNAQATAKSASKTPAPQPQVQQQKSQPKLAPPRGEMQSVMTKSGVMIKIPKAEIAQAKRTGTITTKDGLVIKVGKEDVEEAQKKKGEIVMTAGGVPIKITPSGALVVEKKGTAATPAVRTNDAKTAKAKSTVSAPGALKSATAAKKPPAKPVNVRAAPPRTGQQSKGPQVVTRKDFTSTKASNLQTKTKPVVKGAGT
jgi:hypothetical protein